MGSRLRWWLVPWIVLALCGCVAAGREDVLMEPSAASQDEGRLVIVTVDNGEQSGPPRPASTRPGYVATDYVSSDVARATARALEREYGLMQVAAWPIELLKVHCVVLRVPEAQSREQVLQRLSRDPRVRLAQAMNGFEPRAGAYNDPYLSLQRGFLSIAAVDAQQWSRGEKVRVAVIDTGVDARHPDFGGRVVVRRNFVDRDEGRFASDRHGTAVAGVISASANNGVGIVGVAPAVEIIALKACWQLDERGDAARCNTLTIAQALAAAMQERAQVVNLSLTGPLDPLLNSMVAAGVERGILYVGAAPVDGKPEGFPGGAPGIIPVDMSESVATRAGVLRAPGRDVVTLAPGGRYDFVSGSSLATAHVSGAVALLLARDRSLGRDAVYRLLSQSEGRGDAPGGPINACAALASLLKQAACPELRLADPRTSPSAGAQVSSSGP